MLIRLLAALVAIAAFGATPASAFLGKNTEKVRILYGPTDNPVHELIAKSLKEHRVLETLQELLSGFKGRRGLESAEHFPAGARNVAGRLIGKRQLEERLARYHKNLSELEDELRLAEARSSS